MDCKLTDRNGQTRRGCQWGEGVSHKATGQGTALCSDGVIHYYTDPLLAVFADPIHGNFGETALLWEFEPDKEVASDALKKGCKRGTTIEQIEKPVITLEQRVSIAIKLALLVYTNPKFVLWANAWLSGKDRSAEAAWAAESAARSAQSAAWSAAWSVAVLAAEAARSAESARSARSATEAAWWAARSAESAAWAAQSNKNLDILAVIKEGKV